MNVLDENIPPDDQRDQLHAWRIRVRQVGLDLAAKGVKDDALVPFLLTLRSPTFFTRDRGFYNRRLCHARYCLVVLDLGDERVAEYVRRFLHHRAFNTRAKRMGSVVRVSPFGITAWPIHAESELKVSWID